MRVAFGFGVLFIILDGCRPLIPLYYFVPSVLNHCSFVLLAPSVLRSTVSATLGNLAPDPGLRICYNNCKLKLCRYWYQQLQS